MKFFFPKYSQGLKDTTQLALSKAYTKGVCVCVCVCARVRA